MTYTDLVWNICILVWACGYIRFTMPPSPRYTDEQRAEAVALYAEVGPSEAERQLGILKGTIARWAKAAGVDTVSHPEKTRAATEMAKLKWEERRATMIDRMGEIAEKALTRVEDSLYEIERIKVGDHEYEARYTANSSKGYATTMAILIDKAQLLGGGSTSRTEHLAEPGTVMDGAKAAALRLVAS